MGRVDWIRWLPGLAGLGALAGALFASSVDGNAQLSPPVRVRAVAASLAGGKGLELQVPSSPACLRIENLRTAASPTPPFGKAPLVIVSGGPGTSDLASFTLEAREGGALVRSAVGRATASLSPVIAGGVSAVAVTVPTELLDGELFPTAPAASDSRLSLEICGRPSPEASFGGCLLNWLDTATGAATLSCPSGDRWGRVIATVWRPSPAGGLERTKTTSIGPSGVVTGSTIYALDAGPNSRGATALVIPVARPLAPPLTAPTAEVVFLEAVSVGRTRIAGKVCGTDQGLWNVQVTATFDLGGRTDFVVLKSIPPNECRYFASEVNLPLPGSVRLEINSWQPQSVIPAARLYGGQWTYTVDHVTKTGTFRGVLVNPTSETVDLTKISVDQWILDGEGKPLAYFPARAVAGTLGPGESVVIDWPAANVRRLLAGNVDAEALAILIVNQLRTPGIGGPVTGVISNP